MSFPVVSAGPTVADWSSVPHDYNTQLIYLPLPAVTPAQDLKYTRQRRRQQQTNLSQEVSAYPVCQNKNQPWLTLQVMTTMWSTGRHQQCWTGNLTVTPSGSRRRYISERRDGVQWTGMRAGTHWVTHTTDFLLRHITTVARTGRRTEQASSDEGVCTVW